MIGAVGDLTNRVAGETLGIVEHLTHALAHGFHPVAAGDALQLRFGHAQRRQMRLQVALDVLRGTRIGDDDPQEVIVDAIILVHPKRRQPQALAGDVRAEGLAAGRAAADIGPMAARNGEAQDVALEKNRHRKRHVVQMRAAVVGIVEHEDVAGAQALKAEMLDRSLR